MSAQGKIPGISWDKRSSPSGRCRLLTQAQASDRDEVEKMIKAKAYRIAIAIGSVVALLEAIGAPVKIKGWP